MYSFGKTPPQSLRSYGASGLLAPNSPIYYVTLFRTNHIGRVSDLLAARLRSVGPDELRLRMFLLLGVFQGYRAQYFKRKGVTLFTRQEDVDSLEEPLHVECGVDHEKIVVGVCFNLSLNVFLNTEGISDRIFKDTPGDPFEKMLSDLFKQSDRMVLKFQPETRKLELDFVLGIKGKIDVLSVEQRQSPEIVIFATDDLKEPPRAGSYTELGDLNFNELLTFDSREKVHEPSTVVQGTAEPSEREVRVSSGSTPTADEEVIRLKGESEDLQDQTRYQVGGGEERRGRAIRGVMSNARKIFRSIFNRRKSDSRPQEEVDTLLLKSENSAAETGDPLVILAEDLADNSKEKLPEKDIDKESEKQTQELPETPAGVPAKTSDSSAETISELTMKFKIQELELQNKISQLQGELNSKENEISQRNKALERAKEQVQVATKAIEKFRGETEEKNEESNFKQKYSLSQRMLNISKEENLQLNQKITELRNLLAQAQMQKTQGPSSDDFTVLENKYDRLYRQAEELKRINRQLTEHLSEPKRERPVQPGSLEETRKRLEAAMKLAINSRKEAEVLKHKIATMQRIEAELKADNARLFEELKKRNAA